MASPRYPVSPSWSRPRAKTIAIPAVIAMTTRTLGDTGRGSSARTTIAMNIAGTATRQSASIRDIRSTKAPTRIAGTNAVNGTQRVKAEPRPTPSTTAERTRSAGVWGGRASNRRQDAR